MSAQSSILPRLLELSSQRFDKPLAELSGPDDFYEALGIDSVDAMSLLTSVEEAFGVEVPDWEVQDVRTFDELAGIIARRAGSAA